MSMNQNVNVYLNQHLFFLLRLNNFMTVDYVTIVSRIQSSKTLAFLEHWYKCCIHSQLAKEPSFVSQDYNLSQFIKK